MTEQINNLVLRFGNVNGTGSASANGIVAKTLFRMGLPIGPKNMFPSNIQGLPTWYEIRVNKDGHTAREVSEYAVRSFRVAATQDALHDLHSRNHADRASVWAQRVDQRNCDLLAGEIVDHIVCIQQVLHNLTGGRSELRAA